MLSDARRSAVNPPPPPPLLTVSDDGKTALAAFLIAYNVVLVRMLARPCPQQRLSIIRRPRLVGDCGLHGGGLHHTPRRRD